MFGHFITFYFTTEIMVLIITLNLLNEEYKTWQILTLPLFHTFGLYYLRTIPSLLLNISISILMTQLLLKYIFRFSWIQALLVTMISFAIYIPLENLLFYLYNFFSRVNYKGIFNSSQDTFFLTIIALIILLILDYLIRYFNFFFLTKSISYFFKHSKNKQIIWIILIIAIENILLIYYFFYNFILNCCGQGKEETILLVTSLIIPAFLFFIIIRLFKLINEELEYITNNETIKNLTQLNFALQTQQHDFKQHLQLLMSLIQLKKFDKAREYMKNITEETELINKVKTGIPALNGLLQYKLALARKLNIKLLIETSCTLEELNMEASKICRIIGNLLDNALEYLKDTNLNTKLIKLIFQQNSKQYLITVTNSLEEINPDLLKDVKKILEPGFTTKQFNHGLGLSIVTDFITQTGGKFMPIIDEKDKNISFLINIPKK